MRPKTVIAGVAVAALAALLVLLFIEVQRSGGDAPSPRASAGPEDRARPEPASASEPARSEPAPTPPPDTPAPADPEDRAADPPKLYVRPVPGARVPDDITPETLSTIIAHRDAAPRGSETAEVQSVARLFNQERYDEALAGALAALEKYPDNLGMIRTVVSSSCALRDAETAREHYARLPMPLRRMMRSRCEKYGVELEE